MSSYVEDSQQGKFQKALEGHALLKEIRDKRLYRNHYDTFEEFLEGEGIEEYLMEVFEPSEGEMPKFLSDPESSLKSCADRLEELESVPSKKNVPASEMGCALREIRDTELHKLTGHSTFNEYCSERHDLGRRWREALLVYAELADVCPTVDTSDPTNIRLPEGMSSEDYVKAWKLIREIGQLT